MQGYRVHMEDSHTHILSLPEDPGTSFFAVYDGHGGANIGKYASKHLHKFITKRPEYETDVSTAMKLVIRPNFAKPICVFVLLVSISSIVSSVCLSISSEYLMVLLTVRVHMLIVVGILGYR